MDPERDMTTEENLDKVRNPVRVLFFGRSGCEATDKCLSHLITLGCDVTVVLSERRSESIPEGIETWAGHYIFCFRSLFVLPKYLLDRAEDGAINFHPGPVNYPGSGCVNLALYDCAEEYGITAHLMNERIDNGRVIECQRFPIFPFDSVDSLLKRTHLKLLNLFLDLTTELILIGKGALDGKLESSAGELWIGTATKMKDLENLWAIPIDVTQKELERLVRATYTHEFPPFIEIFGYKFLLSSPEESS